MTMMTLMEREILASAQTIDIAVVHLVLSTMVSCIGIGMDAFQEAP